MDLKAIQCARMAHLSDGSFFHLGGSLSRITPSHLSHPSHLSGPSPHGLQPSHPCRPTLSGKTPHTLRQREYTLYAEWVYPFCAKSILCLAEEYTLIVQGVYPVRFKVYTHSGRRVYSFRKRCGGFGWRGWGIPPERVGRFAREGQEPKDSALPSSGRAR